MWRQTEHCWKAANSKFQRCGIQHNILAKFQTFCCKPQKSPDVRTCRFFQCMGNFVAASPLRVNLMYTLCMGQNSIICHCFNGPREAIFLFGQVRNILITRNWSASRVCSRSKRVSPHKANRSRKTLRSQSEPLLFIYFGDQAILLCSREIPFCALSVQRVSPLRKLIPWNNTSLWRPLFCN